MNEGVKDMAGHGNRANFDRNLAIVIGINQYQNGIARLNTAKPDAEKLAELLEKDYQYQVELLTDDTERKPTRKELVTLLTQELPQKLQTPTEVNRLIVYFAGHGMPLESDEGPRGFLLPQDADPGDSKTFLPMQVLHDALIALPCHHLLIILDCCFAGTFRWATTRKLIPIPETLHREHYDRFIRYPAWQVITSAAHDQEALDFLSDKRGISDKTKNQTVPHSPFAEALFAALEAGKPDEKGIRYKQGDLTRDGVITASELYLYLRDSVETRSGERQTPGIYPLKKHDRGEYIFHDPDFNPNSLSEAPPLDRANNPYRGLKPFEEQHARFFFGRQELIENLYRRITLPNHPLTVVLGVSGSGKSSLVKAGLFPLLRQDKIHTWQILPPMRPGESPFSALATTLLPIVDATPELSYPTQPESEQAKSPDFFNTFSQQLQSNSNRFIELIQSWSQQHPNAHLLLLIDQFEELITLARNPQAKNQTETPDDTQQFLNLLETAIAADLPQLRIIITLRSDFEPRFLNSDTLKFHWTQARFPVRAMRSDELRQAIEGPVSEIALYFEPANLVDRLIDEVGQMPGALPLLSFTLSELYIELAEKWRNRQTTDRALTIDARFDQEGGVAGSLTRRANEEYQKIGEDPGLGEAGQLTMRRVMLRMLTLEGGETARRRVPDSELIYPTQEESDRVKQVVDRLVNARLLVRGQLETGEPYVEPAHDFLVRGWGMLQDWINEEKAKETLELQQRLTAQANDWDRNKRPNGLLLPDGDRLKRLEKILLLPNAWFNLQETELIQRSLQQSRELRAKEELPRKAARVLDLLSTQPLQGLVLAIHAIGQNLEDLPKEILSPAQSSLLRAFEVAKERNLMRGHQGGITAVAFSRDGKYVVSGSEDGTVQLWSREGAPIGSPFPGHKGVVKAVAFDPDGEFIVSGGDDNSVRLWDRQGSPIYQPFVGHQKEDSLGNEGRVTSVAFSPDGQYIASGATDSTVRFWSLEGQLISIISLEQNTGEVHIDFSQDGNSIVIGGPDRAVRLWNCQQKSISSPLAGHGGIVNCVAISGDGQYIVSSNTYGITFTDFKGKAIENIASRLKANPFQGHEGGISSVAISSNGQTIVSAGENIRVWNRQGAQIGSPLRGHSHGTTMVTFSHDSQLLASGGIDGTVRLWDAQNSLAVGNPFLASNPSVTFTSNRHIVVRHWDRTSNTSVLQMLDLKGKRVGEPSVAKDLDCKFSPDGQVMLHFIDHETLQLIDKQGSPISKPFGRHQNFISCTAFSSNSQFIATGGDDAIIQLWDKQGNLIAEPFEGHEFRVTSVAFSPNDEYIVSGSIDRTVRLWDMQGKLINTFQGHRGPVNCVAFSPNGQYIASGSGFPVERTAPVSWDNTIRLWDVKGNPIGLPIEGHEARIVSLAFSPDSRFIASGSEDSTVRIWRASWEAWLQGACDRLRYHPVFTNPESIEDPEQREIAIAACKTCEKYVWSKVDNSDQ